MTALQSQIISEPTCGAKHSGHRPDRTSPALATGDEQAPEVVWAIVFGGWRGVSVLRPPGIPAPEPLRGQERFGGERVALADGERGMAEDVDGQEAADRRRVVEREPPVEQPPGPLLGGDVGSGAGP